VSSWIELHSSRSSFNRSDNYSVSIARYSTKSFWASYTRVIRNNWRSCTSKHANNLSRCRCANRVLICYCLSFKRFVIYRNADYCNIGYVRTPNNYSVRCNATRLRHAKHASVFATLVK